MECHQELRELLVGHQLQLLVPRQLHFFSPRLTHGVLRGGLAQLPCDSAVVRLHTLFKRAGAFLALGQTLRPLILDHLRGHDAAHRHAREVLRSLTTGIDGILHRFVAVDIQHGTHHDGAVLRLHQEAHGQIRGELGDPVLQPLSHVLPLHLLLLVIVVAPGGLLYLLGGHARVPLQREARLLHGVQVVQLFLGVLFQLPRHPDVPLLQRVVAVAYALPLLLVQIGVGLGQQLVVLRRQGGALLRVPCQPVFRRLRNILEALTHLLEGVGAGLIPLIGCLQMLCQRLVLILQGVVEQLLRLVPDHFAGGSMPQRQHRHPSVLLQHQRASARQLVRARVSLKDLVAVPVQLFAVDLLDALVAVIIEMLAGDPDAALAQRKAVALHHILEGQLYLGACDLTHVFLGVVDQVVQIIPHLAVSGVGLPVRVLLLALLLEVSAFLRLLHFALVVEVQLGGVDVHHVSYIHHFGDGIALGADTVHGHGVAPLELLHVPGELHVRFADDAAAFLEVAQIVVRLVAQRHGLHQRHIVGGQLLAGQAGVAHVLQAVQHIVRLVQPLHDKLAAPDLYAFLQLRPQLRVAPVGIRGVAAVSQQGDVLGVILLPVRLVGVEDERALLVLALQPLPFLRRGVGRDVAEDALLLAVFIGAAIVPYLLPLLVGQPRRVRGCAALVQIVAVCVKGVGLVEDEEGIHALTDIGRLLPPFLALGGGIARQLPGRRTLPAAVLVLQHVHRLLLGEPGLQGIFQVAFRFGAYLRLRQLRARVPDVFIKSVKRSVKAHSGILPFCFVFLRNVPPRRGI